MTQERNPDEIIQEALGLDGRAETLQQFYAKWAQFYDEDVAKEAYAAPQICVDLFLKHTHDLSKRIKVLDAGCGTGLIGVHLNEAGFHQIDGFDLSQEMVGEARKTNAYRSLVGGINLNEPLSHLGSQKYDVVFCCGVFTSGHVPPTSLQNLLDATQAGGIVITSTRTRYYDESNYQQVTDQFVTSGAVELAEVLKDAPYTTDGNSHYWVYRALG